jgi:hypothetical protein
MDDGCRFWKQTYGSIVRLTSLSVAIVCCGCRLPSATRVEPLEAQLRARERRIDELEHRLAETQMSLNMTRAESGQTAFVSGHVQQITEVELRPTGTGTRQGLTEKIVLGSLLSGGLNRDEVAGDELLSVLVVPTLGDDVRPVTGGRLLLEVFDFTQEAESQKIGQWEFSEAETAEFWHDGIIGTGYRVIVPWQTNPLSGNLTVHARLNRTDGATLDTSSELKIRPPQI